MDYLDPKKKKNKSIRLMIGYALLGIAISMATVIIVYIANGYNVDRQTGEVIQNGLIYIDSKPESATVYLNGELQRGSTDARLVVPAGDYDIELRRDGYHNWGRSVHLEGGSLRRLTYARLFPQTLDIEPVLEFPTAPASLSQSNDKRWLVTTHAATPLSMNVVDLDSAVFQLVDLPLPLDLVSVVPADPGTWDIIEWADDHRTFLAEYKRAGSSEYVLINRSNPERSVNLGVVFKDKKYSEIFMRDRKKDQVFLYDGAAKSVYKGNTNDGNVELYESGVIDFTAFGDDALLFVTATGASEGHVKAVFRKGDERYPLRDIKADDEYLLEMARIGNALVMGIGSESENRVIVYNDPINALEANDFSDLPVPTTVLKVDSPQELSISSDASVILARGGADGMNFASHEFEADRTYRFKLEGKINVEQELKWAEGQYLLVGMADNGQLVVDFDGSNQHFLSPSTPALASLFDRNLDLQYTFLPNATPGSTSATMTSTFLRSAADR